VLKRHRIFSGKILRFTRFCHHIREMPVMPIESNTDGPTFVPQWGYLNATLIDNKGNARQADESSHLKVDYQGIHGGSHNFLVPHVRYAIPLYANVPVAYSPPSDLQVEWPAVFQKIDLPFNMEMDSLQVPFDKEPDVAPKFMTGKPVEYT